MFFWKKTNKDKSKESTKTLIRILRNLERRRSELIQRECQLLLEAKKDVRISCEAPLKQIVKDILYVRKCIEKVSTAQAYVRAMIIRLQTHITTETLTSAMSELLIATKQLDEKNVHLEHIDNDIEKHLSSLLNNDELDKAKEKLDSIADILGNNKLNTSDNDNNEIEKLLVEIRESVSSNKCNFKNELKDLTIATENLKYNSIEFESRLKKLKE